MHRNFPNLSVVFCLIASVCVLGSQDVLADKPAEGKAKTITVFKSADLTVPATFKPGKQRSRIVEHEFQAVAKKDGEEKSARVYMMASGGGIEPNIKRWEGQFADGDKDKNKREEFKIGEWTVHLVDVNGSFAERMGGGPFAPGKTVIRKDYAMTGAILVHPEGRTYFVKMVGPGFVVKENRKAFVEMIKSLKAK